VLRRTLKVDNAERLARFARSLGPATGPAVVAAIDFCSDGRLAAVAGVVSS
jgi:hypothetical protein